MTLHHLMREIEKKVVSNNTGTKLLPLINNDKNYIYMTNSHYVRLLSLKSFKQVLIKKDYNHGEKEIKKKRKNLQFF